MARACETHERKGRCIEGYGGKTFSVLFEDLGIEGKKSVFMWLRTRTNGGLLQM